MKTPKLVITAGKLFTDNSSLEQKLNDTDILIHLNQDMSEDFSVILEKRMGEKWDDNTELTFSKLKVSVVLDCSTVIFNTDILTHLYQSIETGCQKFEQGIEVVYYLYYKDSQYTDEERKRLIAFSDFANNTMPKLYKIDVVAKLYSNMTSTNRPISQEQSIAQIFGEINFSGSTVSSAAAYTTTPFEVSVTTQSKIITQSYTEQIRDNVLRLVNTYAEKNKEFCSQDDAGKILESLNNSLNDFINKRYLSVMSEPFTVSSKQAKDDLTINSLPYSLREAEKELFGTGFSNLFEQRMKRIPDNTSQDELIDTTCLESLLLHETALSIYECAEVSNLLSKAFQSKTTDLNKSIMILGKKVEEELASADYKSQIDINPVKSFMRVDKRKTSEKIFNEVQAYLYSHVYELKIEILRQKIQIQLIEQLQKFLHQFNKEINVSDLGLYDFKNRQYENENISKLLQESLQKNGDIAVEYLSLVKRHFEIPFDKQGLKMALVQDIQALTAVKNISTDLLSYLTSEVEMKDVTSMELVKKIVKTIVSDLIKKSEKPIRLYTSKGASWESYNQTTRVAVYYTEKFGELLKELDEMIDFDNAEIHEHSEHIFSNVIVYDLVLDDLLLYKAGGEA